MVPFVAALIAATVASGAWCASELLTDRVRAWWRAGRRASLSGVLLAAALGVAAGRRAIELANPPLALALRVSAPLRRKEL